MDNLLTFEDYIKESFDNTLKLSNEQKKLLLKYDKEFDKLANEWEKEHVHFANVINMDAAISGIIMAVKTNNINYTPNIEYEHSKLEDDEWCENFIKKINDLKIKFINLNCYISKFYVYRINVIISQISFLNTYIKDKSYRGEVLNYPPQYLYDSAIELLKQNKYVDIEELSKKDDDYKQTYTPEESKEILQKEIDRLGYGWNVVIDNNMVPRMSVRPYHEFRINGKNKFSKVDLESLKVHEIAVHVARKYYGLQSGLYLFIHGFKGNNVYDEGIAIYNSLNKVKKPKPNILFYVCIKIILLYELSKNNIVVAFNKIKSLTGIDDNKIALAIVRASRVFAYTTTGNYSTDEDYLDGYLKVKDMTENERQKLLEIPIGPDQLYEIDTIKKFIKINNFKPLS